MTDISQLLKKNNQGGYKNIFPKTYLDNIIDKESGMTLSDILSGFNMYFLSYTGSRSQTRLQVPEVLRKNGLWITYVLFDNTVVTEWYNSSSIDDTAWQNNSNWRDGSNSLVGDISISSDGNWVINGVETDIPARGPQGDDAYLQFFKNTELNKYFKEFYIEGLNPDTTYCLRTLRWNAEYNNNKGGYQINIGNADGNVVQVTVKLGEKYAENLSGNIKVRVVIQNEDEITGNVIFANTNVSIGTLDTSACCDLAYSPYIDSLINKRNIEEINTEISQVSQEIPLIPPAFNGYALPKNPQTLKVLHVGNSFADQPISRLKLWLDALGIQNVTYGIVMRSGGSLQQHYNSIVNDEPYDENSAFRLYKNIEGETTYTTNVDPTDKSGNTTTSDQIKLSDCLQFTDWDVITFQQASFASGKWETINPYLPTLIKYARYYCPNSGVKIGWQMTWAYAKGYTGLSSYGNSQEIMFNGIVQCAKNVAKYYGIDLIVPNGVVIQNLRSVPTSFWGSDLNSIRGAETWTSETQAADFTDDGSHPNNIAEYCTAAAFVMVIYGACYNKSIRGANAILDNITGNYAKVARQCVLKAIGDRFNVSDIDVNNILE